MKQTFDVLILDAENRQALVTLRSLGKHGLSVAALANHSRNAPARLSRYCSHYVISPASEGTDEYIAFLISFLKKHTVGVIIPSSDSTIAALDRHRHEISKYTRIALASHKSLEIAVNKTKTLEVAETLGIKIPRGIMVSRPEDIDSALHTLRLPVIIKPVESWIESDAGSKRVCPELATTREEAVDAVERLVKYGGEAIFQEYLSGAREAVSLLFARNTVYARFAQVATRTQPPIGGTSVLRNSIPMPHDIGRQAEALIRALDLEGYSEIEFRRDSQGVPYLMEINPRLSASVDVAVKSGVDFPYLIYQWAARLPITIVPTFKHQIGERYLAGDIINLAQTIKERGRPDIPNPLIAIIFFLLSFLTPVYYDYLDFTDLMPMWDAVRGFIIQAITTIMNSGIPL